MPPPSVLLVNKFFHPRAGAETAFLHTRDLLHGRGHRVIDFAMQHPANLNSEQEQHFAPRREYEGDDDRGGVRKAVDGVSTVYSWGARRSLARLLDEERPDVAHLHNVYHQLTLSIVDELQARDIPIVQTLHDWKIACPAYTLFRDGGPCRLCPESGVVNAVRHRCLKGSRAASALAAAEAALAHRRHTYEKIGLFLAPSAFAGDVARLAGMPPETIRRLPYFLPDPEVVLEVDTSLRTDPVFLFSGRLEETKGVLDLLAAFGRIRGSAVLRIAGWGPLEPVAHEAAARDPRIEVLGRVPRERVLAEASRARALVLPSIWEDNWPLAILEAQARGTPVIASDRGGLPECVEHGVDGLTVRAGDVDGLAEAIDRLAADPLLAAGMGEHARARVLRDHRADDHYVDLVAAYEHVIRLHA